MEKQVFLIGEAAESWVKLQWVKFYAEIPVIILCVVLLVCTMYVIYKVLTGK
jgi:hypothetical protein